MFGQYKRLRNEYDGRAYRQGPYLRRLAWRVPRPPATACATSPRKCSTCMKNDSFKGKTVVISGSGNVAIYATREGHAAGRQGRRSVRLQRLCLRPERHQPGCGQGDQAEVARGRINEYAQAVPGAPSTTRAAAASGPSPATSRCPAPRRTRSTRRVAKTLVENGCNGCVRGREHALHARRPSSVYPENRHALRPGQGCQRGRRGHQRPGDEPELCCACPGHSRKWTPALAEYHEEYFPQRL